MKLVIVFILLIRVSHQWDVVTQSKGGVWPLPQIQQTLADFFALDSATFRFDYRGSPCEILDDALVRYFQLIFHPPRAHVQRRTWPIKITANYKGQLSDLEIQLNGRCEIWPHHDMDEKSRNPYTEKVVKKCCQNGPLVRNGIPFLTAEVVEDQRSILEMFLDDFFHELDISSSGDAILRSSSVWGVLRGLETFSQLAYRDKGNNASPIVVNATSIIDFPRFPHRGLMLDSSRHYITKSIILKNLDAMSYAKYNVFHWHIVDDQSFPYQSTVFPTLSENGAYIPATHIYPTSDIVEIIEYARKRGIRVIAEFDTPGHVASWGPGMPRLLTQCYKGSGGSLVPNGFGPLDPTSNSTYDFLRTLLAEVGRLFPDEYAHLGGDEVNFDCWKSNPSIRDFMKDRGFGNDYRLLQSYYTVNLLRIMAAATAVAANQKTNFIVWQEVFDNYMVDVDVDADANGDVDVDLDPERIVVHVWKNDSMSELANVTSNGYRALLSSCFYLNKFQMANDWINFYPCEPLAFNGTDEQNRLVVGGEALLWGEFVDGTNLITRLWPRAFAPAERLWSNETVNQHQLALPRFEEHRCRLVARGINAEPVNGPSFCPSDYLAY